MPGITAPRTFRPGEEVYKEQPYVEILSTEFVDKACSSCFNRSENLKSCTKCQYVKYCGKSCQKNDWSNHRLECQYLKNLPQDEGTMNTDIVRVIGIVILKIKDEDWRNIKRNVLGTEVSFDDIDPHLEEIRENHLKMFNYKARKDLARRFIGDENMPHDDDFMKIDGKVSMNLLISLAGKVISFVLGCAMFDRECISNCNVGGNNGTKIWAKKTIRESEKISVPHQDISFSPIKLRDDACKCTQCSLPYGDSVLSKIIDEKRAFHIISTSEAFLKMWECFPDVRGLVVTNELAEELLRKQEGVLANTNIIYLKFLAIKCFDIGGPPLEKRRYLKKLEEYNAAVFGEYCMSMMHIYDALSKVCFLLGDLAEGFSYIQKMNVLMKYAE